MKPMTPEDLRENIVATYFTLRWGLVVLSVALPVVLYVWNTSAHGTLHETSISAFYGADKGRMRDYLVATLCSVGSVLAVDVDDDGAVFFRALAIQHQRETADE